MMLPVNKYLLVRIIEEQEKKSGVLVPEEFMDTAKPHALVELVAPNKDSDLPSGSKLLVPSHMVEDVEIFGEKYSFVLENNVIGFFTD
tara:strand:- start:1041 stop:1304 length:264 start_codon:yes stop_codon:yes gene_type:complete